MNHGPPASGFDPEPEEDIDLEEGIEGYATADSEDSSMEEDCYDTADESTEEDYDTASDDSNPEDYDTADDFIEEEDDDTEDDPFQDCDEHGRDWRGDGDGGGYFRRESATTTVADLRGANEGDPKVYEEDEAPAVGKQLPPMNEETGGGGCASELRATTWEEWAYPSPSSMRNEEAADKDDKVSKTEGMGGIAEGITEADQQIDIKGEAPATPPPSGTRQSAVRTENLLPVLQGLPELRSGGRWY
ncbi:hypothetical protein GSI_01272 [Ganoderma sinense ZZ0214-1]|uniref:Uncharacterized protein n=1 Tax=Ganoderma sinense ZZ0214-1 TaxID=1077348 RepID=A0A2G8SVF8_9APHY|nr:hypothetical protein GSI_01272 [Ganoderma sinense ZZ0214-1]